MRPSRGHFPPWGAPPADVAGQSRSAMSLEVIAKAAEVLTAALPSVVAKAANMEPVMFMSTASAGWGVAAITLRNSARSSSRDWSLTRTPAPVLISAGSKCLMPSRWIVTISRTSANEPRGCAADLSRATRFTEAGVATAGGGGEDVMARGEGDRAIRSAVFRRSACRWWRAVRLAAGTGGSSARERLTKPLLVRSQ